MATTQRKLPNRPRVAAGPVPVAPAASQSSLRVAQRLTVAAMILAAVAAAIGLLAPGVYNETEWALPQVRGQDLLTLLALPVLAWALAGVGRNSTRATLLWVGLLGYLFYTYTGASFAYHMNALFLVYVALFSLSIFALVAAGAGLDAQHILRDFDERAPRRGVAYFLIFFAVMLTALWVGQLIPFFLTGELPELVTRADTPSNFVFVLDLGIVVPPALLAAWWLWQKHAWGPVVAGYVLVKCVAMALALISMTAFMWLAGQPIDWGLAAAWVLLAVSSLGVSIWYLRHCRS